MNWTQDLTLEFIRLYESYPVLWNPVHKDRKNRNILYDAWQNIANLLSIDVSVDELRKKKESLMSSYRLLARKVRDSSTTGSGAMDVFEPTWFAFNAIDRFLSSTARKKNPSFSSEESENLQNDCELIVQTAFQNDIENIVEKNNDPLGQDIIQDREFVIPQGAPKQRERGGPSQIESDVAKHLKCASNVLMSIATKSQTRHTETLQDIPALYGKLLAAKLRRLPERTQLILQNQIDNLVFQAELDEIDSAKGSNSPNSVLSPASPHRVRSPVSN